MPDRKRCRATAAHVRLWLTLALLAMGTRPVSAVELAAAQASIHVAGLIVILAGLLAFSCVTMGLFLRERRRATERLAAARHDQAGLKASLERLHAILDGEPGIRISFEPQGGPPLVLGEMTFSRSLVRGTRGLLAFRTWLEPGSVDQLERHLDALRVRGESFVLVLRGLDGRAIEARGRAAAGRAVLALVDLEGDRAERIHLAEEAARYAREADALRRLVESMPTPVWRRDKAGRLLWVNSAFARAVETASPAEAVARGAELLDKAVRLRLAQERAGGSPAQTSAPAVAAGERRFFHVIEAPCESGSVGMAMDVSSLEEARNELKRHIAAQARTLDQLTTAVAIFGADKRLKFFNAAYRELFGLDPEWLGSAPQDGAILDRLRADERLPAQADYKAWKRSWLEVYRSPEPAEHWWHLPDGRTLRVVATPDPQGGVIYIYENHTERLGLESRYNALIRVQRETLDNLHEGVVVFGSDGRVRLSNPAFRQIWRLSDAVLAERPHVDVILGLCRDQSDGDGWQRIKRLATSLEEDRVSASGHVERRDGSVVDYVAEPLPDGATLVTFADVTASRQMQRALEERNEALEAADRLKNTFVQHISYELRSPLTNIIGFAELLADPRTGQLSPRQREYAGHILSSSAALLAIINDILDLATIDAGAMELELEMVDIGAVMKSAAEGVRDRVAEGGLGLEIVADPDIGAFRADPKRLRQVIYNLLSNAIGFSERGGRITIVARRDARGVLITVQDQGRGIAPQDMALVFERFEARDRGGSRRRGVGLGLSIVKSLVELHGGSVSIDSALGRGTSVTCRFPAEPVAKVPVRAAG